MDAMNYEMFIRGAFRCGRNSENGAGEDIFRAYERRLKRSQTSKNEKSA